MLGKTGATAYAYTYIENQPRHDLLAMTEADREAFIDHVKETLGQRIRDARIYREAHTLFARAPPPNHHQASNHTVSEKH